MNPTRIRLEKAVALLEMIDWRRTQLHDSNFGSGIERFLVNRELGELEQEILASPGPLSSNTSKTSAP